MFADCVSKRTTLPLDEHDSEIARFVVTAPIEAVCVHVAPVFELTYTSVAPPPVAYMTDPFEDTQTALLPPLKAGVLDQVAP
jgi:hypothetical protein